MKKLLSIALIGGDGAGKTTIARSLEQACPIPMRYVYMGFGMQSSNFALPTSRLALYLKRRSYRMGESLPERLPADQVEYNETRHSVIWVIGRYLNRLAEAWYREIVSIRYQLRGDVIIFDRHFMFDSVPLSDGATPQWERRFDYLYHWIMVHLYPKPGLTIFLDAPGQVLYERKSEATPAYLDRQREAFLEQGTRVRNFVRIDATQPLNHVLEAVEREVMAFCRQQLSKSRWQSFKTKGGNAL